MNRLLHRPDAWVFWTAIGTGLFAAAAILVAIGVAQKSSTASVWSQPLVDVGVVVCAAGIAVYALAFRAYFGGGSEKVPREPSPLERWIQRQLDAAATIGRDRHVQGDKWCFEKMGQWELALVNEMALNEEPTAPGLVDAYRRNPLTELIDAIPPPHGTKEYDDYYRRRLDWLEKKLRELQTGKVEPEPEVSAEHRKELQSIAEGVEPYIKIGRPARYHPPAENGSVPVMQSFRAHFPAVARMLDEWAELVTEMEAAQKALREWVQAEVESRSIDHFGPLPDLVRDAVEHGNLFAWSETSGFLWTGGSVIFVVDPGDDIEAMKKPVDDLLVDAAVSEPGGELVKVLIRVEDARRQILEQLERIRHMHVIRGRCELCAS